MLYRYLLILNDLGADRLSTTGVQVCGGFLLLSSAPAVVVFDESRSLSFSLWHYCRLACNRVIGSIVLVICHVYDFPKIVGFRPLEALTTPLDWIIHSRQDILILLLVHCWSRSLDHSLSGNDRLVGGINSFSLSVEDGSGKVCHGSEILLAFIVELVVVAGQGWMYSWRRPITPRRWLVSLLHIIAIPYDFITGVIQTRSLHTLVLLVEKDELLGQIWCHICSCRYLLDYSFIGTSSFFEL